MKLRKLSAEETREYGFTHKAEITYADLTAAATTQALTIFSGLAAGQLVKEAAFRLVAAFSGGSASALTLKVGWNNATLTDDPVGLIAAAELLSSSKLLAGDGTGAAFAAARTGFAPQESATIEALFTATGANVSTVTAGEVHVYLAVVDLSKL